MTELTKNRSVMCDLEIERGVFKPGKYYLMTPRFDFIGELVAVTAMTYVFTDVSVVFDSGPFKGLFEGKGADVQELEGSDQTVFDRAGCVLHHFA